MIWLAWHMWLLLLIIFALGLFFGWWLFGYHPQRQEADTEPGDTAPEEDALETPAPALAATLAKPRVAYDIDAEPVRPVLFDKPEQGSPDNLQKISGIGPKYEEILNEMGIYYYAQIVGWTPAEVAWLDDRLGFPGRIQRDRWQEQAKLLLLGAGLGTR